MGRFENMETFSRIVEAGSISDAAQHMGLAKSAVSRRLKELETHLGVELFHRTTRRLTLTETGQHFYRQTSRILDDVYEAEQSSAQAHGELRGGLKLTLPSSFGRMHLGPAISDFLHAHPQISFDLDFNDREVDLISEGFDLAVRIGTLADSSLMARRLCSIQMCMCASPAYLEKMGTPQHADDLRKHHCLVYNLLEDAEHWHLYDGNKRSNKIKIRATLKAGNGEFLRDAAVDGQGIVFMPAFIIYEEINAGRLIPLLRHYQYPRTEAYALYPQTRHLSQRVRSFIDFLAQRFEGKPYWEIAAN
jgi:DNA-binding transcriptional LysR family regulator